MSDIAYLEVIWYLLKFDKHPENTQNASGTTLGEQGRRMRAEAATTWPSLRLLFLTT